MTEIKLAALAVNLFIYALFLCGMFLLIREDISGLMRRLSLRRRLRKKNKLEMRIVAPFVYINKLTSAIFGKEIKGEGFIFSMLLVFLLSFAGGLRLFSPLSALFFGVMTASIPLMLLAAGLERGRSLGSREAVGFVSEFYRQYRMNKLNVYTAMDEVIKGHGDFPVCKRQLSRLLLRLRSSGAPEDIKAYCGDMAFALGTLWAHMLSVCIRLAAVKGTDVSAGLEDIVAQLKIANARAEERKRLNSEALRMTLFLVPFLYVTTVLLSVFYLGTPLTRLLKNQFATAEGLLFFTVTVFLFTLNLLIIRIVNNKRTDY